MQAPELELIQFPYSHFNEKARWALDYKGLAHSRRSLLPGPHVTTVKRITGDTLVPILKRDDRYIDGSTRIIEELEAIRPDPPLVPTDPGERRRAYEIVTRFDERIGPLVRRSLFAVLLDHPAMVVRIFASDRPLPARMAYRAMFPIGRVMMKKSMGIGSEASLRESDEGVLEGLDFVAREAGPSGYLVGERFSIADLTAASLLAPAAQPPGSPMDLPRPQPEALRQWVSRWAEHPGVAWVHEQYRRHRGASAEAPAAGSSAVAHGDG